MRVRDDGAGIDPKVLANYGLDGHYGRYGRLGSRPGFDDARAGAGAELELADEFVGRF